MPKRTSPTARVHSGPLRIADLFTDRVPESTAFAEALAAHRHNMDADVDDQVGRNVLVFYGTSGVGKTTLSERLEAWVRGPSAGSQHWGSPPETTVKATARVDLHSSQGRFETFDVLNRIRHAFGKISPKWPAFDVAFYAYWSAYWSATHPNEALPPRGRGNSEFAEGAMDAVIDAFGYAGIPGATIATKQIRKLVQKVKEKQELRTLLSTFKDYDKLLERCAEVPSQGNQHPELLVELASLLDFELISRHDPDHDPAPMVVVFIDSFERLTTDPRRIGERACNHLIFSMPNVLFVITGQRSLDWYDTARTNLPSAGPLKWPTLMPGSTVEPTQHLVGKLAIEDRKQVIKLGRDQLGLQIPDAVIDQLAEESNGLPQYLSLALEVARKKAINNAGPLTTADVTGSLDDLVLRVLEGVPRDEWKALRAAAVFPFFSTTLVAAAGGVDDGCVQRAVTQPMIDHRGSSDLFRYSMHDEIRRAIRAVGHRLPGGWSETDWSLAAQRGLTEVRKIYEEAGCRGDSQAVLEALGLAVSIICEFDVTIDPAPEGSTYEDWLSEAIIFGPSISGLKPYLPVVSQTPYGQAVLDFVTARTTEVTVDESVALLTGIFASPHPLRLVAARHRGYVLRNAARWGEAIASFRELVAESPTEAPRYQLALTLAIARRFQQALEHAVDLPDHRRAQIIHGCEAIQGNFEGWLAVQESRLAFLDSHGRRREALEFIGEILKWGALVTGEVEPGAVDRLIKQSEAVGHSVGIRDGLVAKLLLEPQDDADAKNLLTRLEAADRAQHHGAIGSRTALVKAAIAFHQRDQRALRTLASEINSLPQEQSRRWIPIECLLKSQGHQIDCPATEWTDSYDRIEQRWVQIFEAWRTRTT